MNYFPLFVPLENRNVVVVGAGTVALRRIRVLFPFGCAITVIAPEAEPELTKLALDGAVEWIPRPYCNGDCSGAYLVLAATNDRAVNHAVCLEAEQAGILVNTADCKEECGFYFPGVVLENDTVIGVTANGADHRRAKWLTGEIRKLMEKPKE